MPTASPSSTTSEFFNDSISAFTPPFLLEIPSTDTTSSSDLHEVNSKELLLVLFRACFSGNLYDVKYLLRHFKKQIQLNAEVTEKKEKEEEDDEDEDGITPLMVAASVGHVSIVRELIQAGAHLNLQDKSGWTALHWAINTYHPDVVSYLIDQGCNTKLLTVAGTRVEEFLKYGHLPSSEHLTSLLLKNMDTMSMVSSVSSTIQGPSTPTPLIEKKVMALVIQMLEFEPHGSGGGSSNPSSSMLPNESSSPFHWDTCLPDEMFVLKESSLDAFLKCTFHSPRFPSPHLVVADLWFLVVRYSVYYQPDLFPLFFNALFTKASECSTYISSLMSSVYWFYTWYRFVHFLKRDPKVSLDIHVGGAYLDACLDHLQILYTSTLKWIHVELDKCITKMFVTSKPQRWKTLFKLSQGSMPGSPAANISSLLVFLSAFLQVLQVYQVHRTIVKQVYLHVFSYLNFKFHWHFAQLPVHSRLLALEWRMQWSQLEAWAQHHSYLTPERDDLLNTLIPFTGLLQFIHIWSQWSSLEQVFDLTKTLGVWKPILKRVLPNYRFQDDEEKDAPSLFKECMAWLAMEPDMGPQVCGGEPSSPLVLPLDFGEPLSEQDWVEASEVPVEDRPTLTLEWLELLQRQVP